MVSTTIRNAIAIGGVCCASSSSSVSAFTSTPSLQKSAHNLKGTTTTTLYQQRNSPGFVGFQSDDNPIRGGGGGSPNSRRSMDDPFAPSPRMQNGPPHRSEPRRSWEQPPQIDLNGQIQDRQSNLAYNRQSINEDPRQFDMDRRFSQRPARGMPGDPSMEPRRAWWESSPDTSGRIQGGSRHTYDAPMGRDASHVFLESDGRPLDVEFEVWDGPNNSPTKIRAYSEDGRMRPINNMLQNPQMGRSNTVSVKNVGSMEFPINAGVASVGGGPMGGMGGGLAGSEGAYMSPEAAGFTHPSSPSMARRETVQGGALRTFPLDYSVEAAQVTITTDGLPMNAKVELWGTGSHIKQLAEIYNDDGQRRPFASIIDLPGGTNTIAVTNTGPMEYPIRVVVEPVARMEGWDGREESFGGHLAPWNDRPSHPSW